MDSKKVGTHTRLASARTQLRRVSCAAAVGLASLLASCSSERPLELTSAAPYHAPKKGAVHSATATKVHQASTKASAADTARYVVGLRTDNRVVAYGRGPYICSPSGFGQTSRCVLR